MRFGYIQHNLFESRFPIFYRKDCSQYSLPDAVKRQAAQQVGKMFDLFVTRHDRALEDADFVFGAQ